MARQLTEKQQKLLAVLFDEAGGDLVTAKKLAGYSDASSTTEVMRGIKDEILEATQDYMADKYRNGDFGCNSCFLLVFFFF